MDTLKKGSVVFHRDALRGDEKFRDFRGPGTVLSVDDDGLVGVLWQSTLRTGLHPRGRLMTEGERATLP